MLRWRRSWTTPALLFGAAVILRLWVAGSPMFGEEAANYFLIRHLGQLPTNVYNVGSLPTHLFAARPLFYGILWPGAQAGFLGFRIEEAIVASSIPPLAWALLRRVKASGLAAGGAGVVLALHPWMVLWGVRVFPDSMLTAFILAALLAHVSQRPVLALFLLVAATWTKETGIVALLALGAWGLWKAVRAGEAGLWPIRLDRPSTAFVLAGGLGIAPFLISKALHLGSPPMARVVPSLALADLDHAFLSAWLLLPLLLGLAWPRTRPWSLLGLLFPAFYVAISLGLGRRTEAWDNVVVASLATVAAFLALDEAWRATMEKKPSLTPGRTTAWRSAPIGLALLLLLPAVFTPGFVPNALAAPLSDAPGAGYRSLATASQATDQVQATARFVQGTQNVFLVDVDWPYILSPFSESAHQIGYAYTAVHDDLRPWVQAIEGVANLTVIEKHGSRLNVALRAVYGDCVRFEDDQYAVLAGQDCPGRFDRLRSAAGE